MSRRPLLALGCFSVLFALSAGCGESETPASTQEESGDETTGEGGSTGAEPEDSADSSDGEDPGTSEGGGTSTGDPDETGSTSAADAGGSGESGDSGESGGSTGAEVEVPPPSGEILFETSGSQAQLYLATVGSEAAPVQLTEPEFQHATPAWSADGGWIFFRSNRGGNDDLWRMDAGGGRLVQLTDDEETESFPRPSPSGDAVMYEASGLFVVDFDGGDSTVITPTPASRAGTWSPDGERVTWFLAGPSDIYLTDADGTGTVNLTAHRADDRCPAWSPDGAQIAFISDRAGTDDVFVMTADGTDITALTEGPDVDAEVAWSPDGTHIAFVREDAVTGHERLWVARADGSRPREVSGLTQLIAGFSWSPDGHYLAYSTITGIATSVIIVDLDGENPLFLAPDFADQQMRPLWRP